MKVSRRSLIAGGVAAGASGLAVAASAGRQRSTIDVAPGRFTPDWDSLVAGYTAPDWYRDAKLGIWAHWGPQCVPGIGDWYARQMYVQGTPQWEHHIRV